jgi:two-component system CheB/CheR fusion protein
MSNTDDTEDLSTTNANDNNTFLVVGIGASAGGLEALRAFITNLGSQLNACIIIAQHMDPKHPSLLRELLARGTDIPVEEVKAGTHPCNGVVYITPPGFNISFIEGKFQLEAVSHIGPKPSVDLFLSSLADTMGERSVGVILSGTGSDGAHGIRAIKAAGGITICQDEDSAKYNGMPRAAIETGLVDLIMSPMDIAHEVQILSKNPGSKLPLKNAVSKTSMEQIFQILLEQTDTDFSHYKTATLQRRLQRRMTVHKVETLDEYLQIIRTSTQEAEMLYKDILISVTSFFRDAEAFLSLEQQLHLLVQSTDDNDSIRVWVPGCATGEEPFTIAILLDRVISKSGKDIDYQIFATDIDTDALAHARRGIYLSSAVRQVPPDILERYFMSKDDIFTVVKKIREKVVFARQDIVRSPPFSKLDLIACRNLLIYFDATLQQKIIPLFHYVLRKRGLLFLGKSESIGQFVDLFESIDKKFRIYRKLNTSTTYPTEFIGSSTNAKSQTKTNKLPRIKEDELLSISERLDKAIKEKLTPACVVVDERGDILQLQGDLARFLSLPTGRMEVNVIPLAREELRVDIRALLHKAKREGAVAGPKVTLAIDEGLLLVSVHIMPLQVQANEAPLYGICFVAESIDPNIAIQTDGIDAVHSMRVNELAQELQATREHLQTTIEELETSNEELQSTNEELQSANEELQSTNEELETANEELQSTNEELTTVNEELQIKSSEVSMVSADLESVLHNFSLAPLLVLDTRLRITRFSSTAEELFKVRTSDIGQSIGSLSFFDQLPDLRDPLLAVITSAETKTMIVTIKNHSYRLTISAHLNEQNITSGIVLLFTEHCLQAEENHNTDRITLERIALMQYPAPIVIADISGNIVLYNALAEKIFGYTDTEIQQKNVSILMPHSIKDQHDYFIDRYLSTGEQHTIAKPRPIIAQHKLGHRIPLTITLQDIWLGDQRYFMAFFETAAGDNLHESS